MTEVKYKVVMKNSSEIIMVSSLKSAQELVARYGGSFSTVYSKVESKLSLRKGAL